MEWALLLKHLFDIICTLWQCLEKNDKIRLILMIPPKENHVTAIPSRADRKESGNLFKNIYLKYNY